MTSWYSGGLTAIARGYNGTLSITFVSFNSMLTNIIFVFPSLSFDIPCPVPNYISEHLIFNKTQIWKHNVKSITITRCKQIWFTQMLPCHEKYFLHSPEVSWLYFQLFPMHLIDIIDKRRQTGLYGYHEVLMFHTIHPFRKTGYHPESCKSGGGQNIFLVQKSPFNSVQSHCLVTWSSETTQDLWYSNCVEQRTPSRVSRVKWSHTSKHTTNPFGHEHNTLHTTSMK